ncbi:4-hydroxybenzoate octaprenyltransferase [Candidatus Methylacidiphilum fumarolicum]|uniref:4-hydroxybenzoate polyprenyltransferase n=2 Tax=Candidatus Methylacidiphilum fumarolicum TaxID=591154 RepID=I0JYH8_METFB|nr:UbiA-like polyprenyltransferase [Candidatus Methylacidiphilum fumarolicum]MBW6416021.1 putative 4-hydroxybenzoate polyprenyltransferase [Candidatus Methylacidiphilum fumarolicum]TFE67134.1 4-hydroxybenzoate octaprenyltransferase [Candidatus Methylacidiphilum fumarolicum]TFE71956.1 4-hydroxybenzoate octaprenyltransferase [Candidatus Methylacidiphilum fumarolicum]TFE73916.1 4-hydroxybenzoate octaprenyltransferase [Candidatus Methylacidiphilum fumarolicum]TFE73921.1 4-hydroxybenzoate octapreny
MKSYWVKLKNLLELVKFSHTLFALPFALSSMMVAAWGLPSLRTLIGILLCMVAARTMAMAFNRYLDWEYDKQNPRTQNRSKLATKRQVLILGIISLVIFEISAASLNFLCFALSPVAAFLIVFYSFTKRFSPYSHAVLGVCLSLAPLGAWVAVKGSFASMLPFLLSLAVFFWTFGFDIIYALQDVEFDRRFGLYSLPAQFGEGVSLKIAALLHFLAWIGWAFFGFIGGLRWPYWIALVVVACILGSEHVMSRKREQAKIEKIFFELNAWVSVFIFVGILLSIGIQGYGKQ